LEVRFHHHGRNDADIRVIEAILKSIQSGKFGKVEPVAILRLISRDHRETWALRKLPIGSCVRAGAQPWKERQKLIK
jgi:hypothetical protein